MRLIISAALAVSLLAAPASAACVLSYCQDRAPSRTYITNTSRQIIGDLYDPGNGQRTQIRDNSRRILGHIEADGRITGPDRRTLELDALQDALQD